MEMIALSEHLGVKNILVDERTTRLISEAPFRYKEHLEKEFKVVVMLNKKNLLDIKKIVENMKIIRSSELLILAYEHGMFDNFNSMKKEFLEAGLYSLKYSGCSIQSFEIDKYLGSI